MRILALLGSILAFSLHASDQAWVKENCPRCFQSADQNYLFKVDDQIIKFSPRSYGKEENLKADFIEIIWVGLSDQRGSTTQEEITFSSPSERQHFLIKFQKVCRLFKGYEYDQSEFTKGIVKMSCIKSINEQESAERALARSKPQVQESVSGLVNFLSGSKPKKKNLGIYDESRGEEGRNPGGAERLPASAGVVGQ